MELDFYMFLIVCPFVFVAGFVDAIAGGGGLISLPAYLIAGIPAHNAVATNKLSSSIGTAVATARYIKNGCTAMKLGLPGIGAALIGAQIGARLALLVEDKIFSLVLLVALPILTAYIFLKKDIQPREVDSISFRKQLFIVVAVTFIIGIYDGFYGPGTGTFLIIAYTSLAKMDVLKAGGNTKLANLTSNVSALVVFLLHGAVLLPLGLVASLFGIAGNYLGAGFAFKYGGKGVRLLILIVLLILFCKVLLQ